MPIRLEDRHLIMKWRNEQIYHLRQAQPLTADTQNRYFDCNIRSLFKQVNPDQFLFSYLKGDVCVGYGGLVHINWIDKHAEISFIMDTELESLHFQEHWQRFLQLIEELGFQELKLHKLFVYAFDLRPHLYSALQAANYFLDARLKDHCCFQGKFKDVVIHSKTMSA